MFDFQKLLQVIRFVPGDFNSPVDLLDQDQAYHLMGQGNAAKGDAFIGFSANDVAEAEGSANDEGDFTAAVEGKVRKGRRQFFRRDEFSAYVESPVSYTHLTLPTICSV